jgi:hypothetical protein
MLDIENTSKAQNSDGMGLVKKTRRRAHRRAE